MNSVESRLIFLISMPRSGSTLLQKILSTHKEIATSGEPWLMLPIISGLDSDSNTSSYGTHFAANAIGEFERDLGLTGVWKESNKIKADYVYEKVLEKSNAKYFLDKTPRYIHVVDKLYEMYPSSKFIILLRDPKSIIASYAKTWKNSDFNAVLNDPYYRNDFEKGFSFLSKFSSDRNKTNKLVVEYEELVSSPKEKLKEIFDYLELDFSTNLLNYSPGKKYKFGDPKNVYDRQKIDPSSVDDWINVVSRSNSISPFLKILQLFDSDAVRHHGYQIPNRGELVKLINEHFDRKLVKSRPVFIVTPCFNAEETIERTLRSVADQVIPDGYFIRYHVQDGGSSDSTLQVLERFKKHIAENRSRYSHIKFTYSSKNDSGMYDAIVQGFSLVTGEFEPDNRCDDCWMTWINSDDFLAHDSVSNIVHLGRSDYEPSWITGAIANIDTEFNYTTGVRLHSAALVRQGLAEGIHMCFIQQEGTFWRKSVWDSVDAASMLPQYKYAGDWNLWRTFAEHEELFIFEKPLGYFCKREGQLSSAAISEYYSEIDNTIARNARREAFNKTSEDEKSLLLSFDDSGRLSLRKVSVSPEVKNFRKKLGIV